MGLHIKDEVTLLPGKKSLHEKFLRAVRVQAMGTHAQKCMKQQKWQIWQKFARGLAKIQIVKRQNL